MMKTQSIPDSTPHNIFQFGNREGGSADPGADLAKQIEQIKACMFIIVKTAGQTSPIGEIRHCLDNIVKRSE